MAHKLPELKHYSILKSILVLLLIIVGPCCYTQESVFNTDQFGFSAGATLSIGTHVNRLGIFASAYYHNGHVQLNALGKVNYSFRHLGPNGSGWEKQVGLGLVYGFQEGNEGNPFHHLVSNQMHWQQSIGFGYTYYRDDWETSQFTGTVGYQAGNFELVHENDAFGISSDRYRTSAILVAYRHQESRVGLNNTLWTGNGDDDKVRTIHESDFARFGYKDLSEARHGKFSNGLLSAQWDQAIPYGQTAKLNVGVDSERVRNLLQNKIMHDMYIWPEKWNTAKNPHVPMLDRNGNPYIYGDGQKVKKTKFYFNLGWNENGFY